MGRAVSAVSTAASSHGAAPLGAFARTRASTVAAAPPKAEKGLKIGCALVL